MERETYSQVHHDRKDTSRAIVLEYGPGLRVLSSSSEDMSVDEVVQS